MSVRIQTEDFDISDEIRALRESGCQVGAVASFIGLVRDVNDGEAVSLMSLEHYPGMTEKAIEAIITEAKSRWCLLGVRVIHRVGTLRPSEQIVLVAVASGHRAHAFEACEFIMDYLKTKAPFWKKETVEGDQTRWVDARQSDTQAAKRWQHESDRLP